MGDSFNKKKLIANPLKKNSLLLPSGKIIANSFKKKNHCRFLQEKSLQIPFLQEKNTMLAPSRKKLNAKSFKKKNSMLIPSRKKLKANSFKKKLNANSFKKNHC